MAYGLVGSWMGASRAFGASCGISATFGCSLASQLGLIGLLVASKLEPIMTNTSHTNFRLFVATSTRENAGPFKDQLFAYAWALVTDSGKPIARDANPFGDGGKGDHTKGVFPAIRDGLKTVLAGASVAVITQLKHVRDHLNTPPSDRRRRGYLKSNKTPFADKAALIVLDDDLEGRSISISGRTPADEFETTLLGELQDWAHEKAKNSGLRPKDWNL